MTATPLRPWLLLIILVLLAQLVGCAATPPLRSYEEPPMHTLAEFDDEVIAHVDDPWERFNRRMYTFNYRLDQFVFLPVVDAYETVTPRFVRTGVSNFFSNIGEICTLYNSLLQFRGKKAATTTGRFLVNSTIGLVGLFDPATSMGLKRQNEDFGQTLGHWGVDSGPYVVLPVLGPNTVRGTGGIAVDTSVHIPLIDQVQLDSATELGTDMLKGVDTRHRQSFRYYQSGYPFEYSVVRFVIRKKTELSVLK